LTGVAVGVGVNVAQLPEARQTASGTKSQLVGHVPSAAANAHDGASPPHWQQLTGVGMGVGVNVAQLPEVRQTARGTKSQFVGHVPSMAKEHEGASPPH